METTDESINNLMTRVHFLYGQWRPVANVLYESLAENHLVVSCQKGCGACCHFPLITAASVEAFVLYHELREACPCSDSFHDSLRNYTNAYFALAREYGSLPFTNEQQRLFFAHNLPCPFFLTDNSLSSFGGHCAIHPSRPVICDSFHSLDTPQLCARKQPHRTAEILIGAGEEALRQIRDIEYEILGRSTLGHLPIFLAAFATPEGQTLYRRGVCHDGSNSGQEEEYHSDDYLAAQDFQLFAELLAAAGYVIGEADIASLLLAQQEVSVSLASTEEN